MSNQDRLLIIVYLYTIDLFKINRYIVPIIFGNNIAVGTKYRWNTRKASQSERFEDMFEKSIGLVRKWSEIEVGLEAA